MEAWERSRLSTADLPADMRDPALDALAALAGVDHRNGAVTVLAEQAVEVVPGQ
jgi:hypothetical protein